MAMTVGYKKTLKLTNVVVADLILKISRVQGLFLNR